MSVASQAINQDAARIGRLQARDDAQKRGLAAAGRTEKRNEFAAGKIEGDVVEGAESPERFDDVLDCDAHPSCSPVAFRAVRHSTYVFESQSDEGQQRQ